MLRLFLTAVVLYLATVTAKADRFALIIANAAYNDAVGRLDNPINDANLVATALRGVGFADENITIVTDASRGDILSVVDRYVDRIARAGPDAI